jgi:flagellar biosynthesis/type III secretory pathway protein FliH
MKTFIDEYIEQGRKKGKQEGRQEGMQQGMQEGRQEGMQQAGYKILSTQLTHRFGDLPKWATEKIDNADIDTLEKWSLRLLSAKKLDEVFH